MIWVPKKWGGNIHTWNAKVLRAGINIPPPTYTLKVVIVSLPIPVTVNSTIKQEFQFGFKNHDQNIAQNNQNIAQNQMQLTNVFFNLTSRRDGTRTQFIRIKFYLTFPLQSSQYFHWLLYWTISEHLFWDKFGFKKNLAAFQIILCIN